MILDRDDPELFNPGCRGALTSRFNAIFNESGVFLF